ncbi:hypothetical protein [Pseudomonas cedrina]|uniref:hypothetical protein n=1 Tax=Pseudomonas cedrina TaxID=651740 RepID=UPI0027845847|nr:hypothetical protein [Pseudomonas cedrina]MDQ0654567.1 hypothetical protein [Pseudomonas cedrina]
MPKHPREPYGNKPAKRPPKSPARPPKPAPTRTDDLDRPYALFDPIPISHLPGESEYAFGLGIRQVDPYTKWGFEQWFNWALFDRYALYFNNSTIPVAQDNAFEEQDRYYLTVLEENVPEGKVIVQGRVERQSGNQSWSPPFSILIKKTRPARDRNPGDTYHSGLHMRIIDFPEGTPLTPENIGTGVTVEFYVWENARRNDRIDFSWDGLISSWRISDDEAKGLTPIYRFIEKSIILKGSLNGDVLIRFTVTDLVENPADEKFPWSKPYCLRSELDPDLLLAPLFLVNDDETTHVDWDSDNDAVFEVLADIFRVSPRPVPPRQVHVVLHATLADKTIKEFPLPPVTDANIGHVFLDVDSDIIEQIVGGQFSLSFKWREANGDLVNASSSRTVVVSGTYADMPPPSITPSILGQVDPSKNALFGLPYYIPHNPGWQETAYLEHVQPNGGTIEWNDPLLAGPQGGTRTIPAAELARFDGKDAYAYYTTRDGGTGQIRKSKKAKIQVGAPTADMPPAELQGRIGNNVDPADVVGDPRVTLPYDGTRDKDTIFWNIIGSALGGSDNGSFTIDSGSAGKPLVFTVDRKILDLNSSLTITYALLRPGPPVMRLFAVPRNLTVGAGTQLDRPIIEHASQYPDELNPRAALYGTRVIVKYRPMQMDQIKVSWLSDNGFGSVDKLVQGNPSTNEVSVDISSRTIAKCLTKYGQIIQIHYSFSRGNFPFKSPTVYLKLLPLTGLPTPRIDDFDGPYLPLAQLNPSARTRVSKWAFSHEEQFMWLRYIGTNLDGSTYIHDTYDAEEVGTEGQANGVNAATPYEGINGLKDGSVFFIEFLVSFAESPHKATAIPFGVRSYTVQRLASILPAPKFANLPGTIVTINPVDYLNYAFVAVAYAGMNSAHWIELDWLYPDGTKAYVPGKNGLDGGRVDFPISVEIMAASLGKTIVLRFTATINGKASPSYTQTLIVEGLTDQQLPYPLINSTPPGGTLDLRTHSGNALASVAHWFFARKNQKVWITCYSEGVNPLSVLSNYPVTEQEASNGLINKVVSRDWLDLLIADKIQVICDVTFDGSDDRPKATRFPVVDYFVLNKWIKDFTPFTDSFLNNWVSFWPNDSIHREPNGNYFLRIAPLTGQGARITKIYTPTITAYYLVTLNFRVDKEAAIGGPTTIEIRLGSFRFTHKMFEVEKWEIFSTIIGPVPSGAFTAEIRVNNPTTRGLYDFDNIRVQQRPFPG